MAFYHDELMRIKKAGNVDFMKITYEDKQVVLKTIEDSDETVHLLTKWRRHYENWFGTTFRISEERTKKWINNGIIDNPDRSLFMIYVNGKKFGCIGTIRFVEEENSGALDAMIRDPEIEHKGLMLLVEKAFLKWMFDGLKLSKITGYLFSDNVRMMDLHKKCGWTKIEKIPLKKIQTKDGTEWVRMKIEDKTKPERYFDSIKLTRINLLENMDDVEFQVLKL